MDIHRLMKKKYIKPYQHYLLSLQNTHLAELLFQMIYGYMDRLFKLLNLFRYIASNRYIERSNCLIDIFTSIRMNFIFKISGFVQGLTLLILVEIGKEAAGISLNISISDTIRAKVVMCGIPKKVSAKDPLKNFYCKICMP